MKDHKVLSWEVPAEVDANSPLEQLIAQGARKMLQAALEQEIEAYLEAHRGRQSAEARASVFSSFCQRLHRFFIVLAAC